LENSDFRYEIKYNIPDIIDLQNFDYLKKINFEEIYPPRVVNSIYFDNYNFDLYNDSILGHPNRLKYRVRWYDKTINKANLEIKRKIGSVGNKSKYRLVECNFIKNQNIDLLIESINKSKIKDSIKQKIISMRPILYCSYLRKYFLSIDGRFRITIDKNLIFSRTNDLSFKSLIRDNTSVLEIKFNESDYPELEKVIYNFPFIRSRFSKYVRGINIIFKGNYKNY